MQFSRRHLLASAAIAAPLVLSSRFACADGDASLTNFGGIADTDTAAAGLANKTAILNAIDALQSAKKTRLSIPRARWFFKDDFSIDLPRNIKICGEDVGPFELYGQFASNETPATKTVAPTLLFRDQNGLSLAPGGSCNIRMEGDNTIQDVMVWYPDQHSPTWGGGFINYPWAIANANDAFRPGINVRRVSLPMVSRGIQIWGGRYDVADVYIGAFNQGLVVDGAADGGSLRRVYIGPRWVDIYNSTFGMSNLDSHALANLTGFELKRADAFAMRECAVFQAYTGFKFSSPEQNESVGTFGFADMLRAENCYYGIMSAGRTSGNGILIGDSYFVTYSASGSYFRAQTTSVGATYRIKGIALGLPGSLAASFGSGSNGYYDFREVINRVPTAGEIQ